MIEDTDHIDQMISDFFAASKTPSSTHETWLLRICSMLLDREAQISFKEQKSMRANARRHRKLPASAQQADSLHPQ